MSGGELLQLSTKDYRYLVNLTRQRARSCEDALYTIQRRRNISPAAKAKLIRETAQALAEARAVLRRITSRH